MAKGNELNLRLCELLGIRVFHHPALLADQTFATPHIKDANGRASRVPDFWNDMCETVRYLPRDVQFHLRWSNHSEQWACLLTRGTEIYEGFGDSEGEAAARAFEQLLTAQAVTA